MPPKFKVISLKDAKKKQENSSVASSFRSGSSADAASATPQRGGASSARAGINGSTTATAAASPSFSSAGSQGAGPGKAKVVNPYAKKNAAVNPYAKKKATATPVGAANTPSKRPAAPSTVAISSTASATKQHRPPPAVDPFSTFSQAFGEFDADEGRFDEEERSQQRAFDAAITSSTASSPGPTTTAPTAATISARENQAHLQPHVLHVSTRQRGNPILSFVRNVPFEHSKMVPDYIMGPTRCALFLSLRYHNLHPDYIHRRVAELRSDFDLRVLLCLVDVEDNTSTLLMLNDLCVQNRLSLLLAWSEEEAARYLETFKAFDGRDASSIQKREHVNYADQVSDVLGSVRSINKTDAGQLLMQFGNLKNLVAASVDELSLCPGVGPKKVRRLYEAFRKPFSSRAAKRRRERKEEDEFQKALKESKEAQKKKNDGKAAAASNAKK